MNKKYSYISNIRYGWAERKLSSNRVYYSFILSVSIIVDWPEQRDNPPPFRSVFERLAGEEDLEDFRNREAEETAFILWKLMDGPTMIDIRRIEGRIATILHNVSSRRNRLSGREFKRRWETPSGKSSFRGELYCRVILDIIIARAPLSRDFSTFLQVFVWLFPL